MIARSFNHVGPRQAPSFVASSIAKQIAEIEAGKKPPVLSMGNLDSRARHHGRPRHGARVSGDDGVGHARAPYNVCSGTPVPIRALVELMKSKARVPITIEQDPARFRPIDTPLVLGDH